MGILGLWAIADCARDISTDADVALANARRKQKRALAELNAERSCAQTQEEDVAERVAKRARVMAQLCEVDEAVSAAGRLAAGQIDAPAEQDEQDGASEEAA